MDYTHTVAFPVRVVTEVTRLELYVMAFSSPVVEFSAPNAKLIRTMWAAIEHNPQWRGIDYETVRGSVAHAGCYRNMPAPDLDRVFNNPDFMLASAPMSEAVGPRPAYSYKCVLCGGDKFYEPVR